MTAPLPWSIKPALLNTAINQGHATGPTHPKAATRQSSSPREARGRPTFRYRSVQKMLAGVTRRPRTGSERYTAEAVCRQRCSRSHTGMAAPVATGAPPPLLGAGELPGLSKALPGLSALPPEVLAGAREVVFVTRT